MADHDANIDNTFDLFEGGASEQAERAYQEVVQYLEDNPDANIELTGHSEGGYEAQYVTARLAIDRPDLVSEGRVSCSTVNAPGLTDSLMQELREVGVHPEDLPCTNVIVEGDIVSRVNGENRIGNEMRVTGGEPIHDDNGNVIGYEDGYGDNPVAAHKSVDAVDRLAKSDPENAEREVSELNLETTEELNEGKFIPTPDPNSPFYSDIRNEANWTSTQVGKAIGGALGRVVDWGGDDNGVADRLLDVVILETGGQNIGELIGGNDGSFDDFDEDAIGNVGNAIAGWASSRLLADIEFGHTAASQVVEMGANQLMTNTIKESWGMLEGGFGSFDSSSLFNGVGLANSIGTAIGSWAASELLAGEIDSEAEAMGVALGSAVGSVVGQIAIPIPGVGSAIGSFAGSFVGGYLGEKWNDWENGATGLDIVTDIAKSVWELPEYALNAFFSGITGGSKPKVPEAYVKYEFDEASGEYKLVESNSKHGGSVATAKDIAGSLGDAIQSMALMFGGQVAGSYPDILVEHEGNSWRVNGIVEDDISYAITKAALFGAARTPVESADSYVQNAFHGAIRAQHREDMYGDNPIGVSVERVQQDVMLAVEREAYDSNTAIFVGNVTKDDDGNLLAGDVVSEAESQLLSVYKQIAYAQDVGGEDGASIMANIVELSGANADASAEDIVMSARNDLLTALKANGLTDQYAAINSLRDFAAIEEWAGKFETVGLREYVDMKLSTEPTSDDSVYYRTMLGRTDTLRWYGGDSVHYKIDYEAEKQGIDLDDYGWEDLAFKLDGSVFTLVINDRLELPIDFSENGGYSLASTHLPIAGSVMNLGQFINDTGMADGSLISGHEAIYALFGSEDVEIDSVVIDWDIATDVKGSADAELILTGSGDDVIRAGGGDDYIVDAAGNDDIDGGAGFDTVSYGHSENGVYVNLYKYVSNVITLDGDIDSDGEGSGDDDAEKDWRILEQNRIVGVEGVIGSSSDDILIGNQHDNELIGGLGDDQLQGGSGDDVLDGGGGKDVLSGGQGHDTVSGGAGDDFLSGGRGRDVLRGDAGSDVMQGGDDDDRLSGGEGDDALYGDWGDDRLDGGSGDDELHGGYGDDELHGGDGADYLMGDEGFDVLYGGSGDDYILGGARDDILRGGDGADYLDGGKHDDYLDGGDGADYLQGGDGNDELLGGAGADVLEGGAGSDVLTGGAGDDALLGGTGDDSLDGGDGADSLSGGAGNDILIGGAGDDRISGGTGRDVIDGGAGIDTVDYGYSVLGIRVLSDDETGRWLVHERGGSSDFVTGIENILATDFDDVIATDSGDNVIHAGAGDDLLSGGGGADELRGGRGTDTAIYTASSAGVAISLAAGSASGGDAEGDKLFDIENLTGSAFNDSLTGDGGDNKLLGGAGADVLSGGAGADILRGDDGDDKLSGGAGADVLSGGVGTDILSGGMGADILDGGWGYFDTAVYADSSAGIEVNLATGVGLGGDAEGDRLIGIEQVEGSGFDDVIVGNSENNVLYGATGDDILDGGAGRDELHGGEGRDELHGGDGRDELHGGAGGDKLHGGARSDKLYGGAGNDELHGGSGSDKLEGGAGEDRLYGDAGRDKLHGGDGSDELYGGDGSDELYGGAGSDELYGGDSHDRLEGGAGADKLYGGSGRDRLEGGDGADILAGGEGWDWLVGGAGADWLYGNAGQDELRGGAGDDFLDGGLEDDELFGGEGNDELHGGAGADILDGGLGDDALHGGTGDDELTGGAGDDYLSGGSGSDQLYAGDGDDTVLGGSGNNFLHGEAGDDELHGGSGFDRLYGGEGSDSLYGGESNDILDGGAGADLLEGGDGADRLRGGSGDDYLSGGAGADTLDGGAGDDALYGGTGYDELTGGAGDDYLSGGSGSDKLYAGDGDDTVLGGSGNDFLRGEAGDDELHGGSGFDRLYGGEGSDSLYGGEGVDILDGGAGADLLEGGDGTDRLRGGSGDDYLSGGAGADTLDGGAGDDALYGGSGRDELIGGEGDDSLRGGDDDDKLSGGAGADSLYGDAGDDYLSGGAGADSLHGGAGSDGLLGGDGNDELWGGDGADRLHGELGDDYLDGGTGADVIYAGAGADIVYGGDDSDYIDGGEGADVLSGDAGADVILAGAGADEAYGGEGDDELDGGQGDDLLRGGAGADIIYGGRGEDDIAGGSGDDLLYGGAGSDKLVGNAGDDRIIGDMGDDYISGGSGDDFLYGGEGDDTLVSGSGSDHIYGGTGSDTLILQGNSDDYEFLKFGESILAHNSASGEIDLISSIEFFQFTDGPNLSLLDIEQQLDELKQLEEESQEELDGYGNPSGPGKNLQHSAQSATVAMAAAYAGILSTYTNAATTAEYGYFSDENVTEVNPLILEALERYWGIVSDDDGDDQGSANADAAEQSEPVAALDNGMDYSDSGQATDASAPVDTTTVVDDDDFDDVVDDDDDDDTRLNATVVDELEESETSAEEETLDNADNTDDDSDDALDEVNASAVDDLTDAPEETSELDSDDDDEFQAAVTELNPATVAEDGTIALDLMVRPGNVGSELSIFLNLPEGASLNHGVLQDGGRWKLSLNDLEDLRLTASAHSDANFSIGIEVLEYSSDKTMRTVSELPVTVNAVADAPDLAVSAAEGAEDSAIALDIASSLVDVDGSETLQVYLEGVPADASLSAGVLLDDGRWLLSSDELTGLQLTPGVNNSDDFVLTVRALASEGENGSQAETVLELPVSVNAIADAPDLVVSAAEGAEDSAIALDIASNLVDVDGSEALQVYLEGVPSDASLSAGVLLDDGRWLLSPDELSGLQLTPGINNSDDFVLTVRAVSSESENGSQAETVLELPVSVNAVADAPELAVSAAVGAEDNAIALDIASSLVDVDGSESLQVYLEGVPSDASLSAGVLLDDGRWLLSSDELAGLQLTPGVNNGDDFVLTVRALASEAENGSQAETVLELPVSVNAVADAPELAVSAAVGAEDSAIALDITSSLADVDGSESLQVYLEGVPSDASLSAGVLLDDGRWLLSSDELAGLQLTPGVNNGDDFVLTVRALASEAENGSQAETVLELPVSVNAVADAPELAVSAAVGAEDNAIALDIASGLVDADGSETLQVYLEGVPADASLSAGVLLDDGRWLLSPDELAGLQLAPGVNNSDDFVLTVRAVSSEGENGSQAETVLELPVAVNAVADAPDLAVSAAEGDEDNAIALDIASSLVDVDGSETLQVYLEGVPGDASLSAGVLLDDGRWLLSSDELAGLQLTPGINNSDDFVLTVRALASEGENGSQAETVLELPVSVNAVADAPDLAVSAAVGNEDSAITLDVASSLVDVDGSESLQVYLEGVPSDANLSAGELLDDGRWLLNPEDLDGLQLNPGEHNSDNFTLTVRALSHEGENDSVAETVTELPVIINAVADAPELTVTEAVGNEDSAIALDIASSLVDIDGSETLQIYLEGVPGDASLSAGMLLDDGRWLLSSDELAGLQLTPGINNSDDFVLTVRAVSSEGENGSSVETVLELPVTVNAIADAPELVVSAAVSTEDSAIALDVACSLVDLDGSETLEVYLEGVPADASLSAGELLEDGRWLLSREDLAGLQLNPGEHNGDDFTLTVRTLSREGENGSSAETVAELPVTINAVADAPELTVTEAVGNEDSAIALDIAASLVDTDASEDLSIYIDNIPTGARLSAGELLDDGRWVLEAQELDGLLLYPAENDDSDLLLEVRALSREGENGDLAETVSMLPVTVRAVADTPELVVTSASGQEDSAIALDIATTMVDADVSEQAHVYIESIPEGAFLNQGSEIEPGVWRLTPDQLQGLTITPAANDDSDFDLVVRSVSVESANGDSAESLSSLRVEVAAVADTPALEVAALVANEDQSLPLTIDASALDTDGSESLKIYVSGLFPGAALSAGLVLDDGRWLLDADELDGLRLNVPEHYSGDFNLEVKAVSTELVNGSSAETTLDLPVTIEAVADAPELAVAAAVGTEDSAIALDIAASLVDIDGSEMLQIYLEGVPTDASLSAGELLEDGRWLLDREDLVGLQLTPGEHNSNDFTLIARALSSEDENDSVAETVAELSVTINAVADTPELEVTAAVGAEDSTIALDINSSLVDVDGSETLQIYLEGVPADASLSAGELLDDGRWLLSREDLDGLQLTPGEHNGDDFTLTVRALSREGENDSVAETVAELPVTINAVADAPELEVTAAVGTEDSAIALDIAASLVDIDGSETLQIYLEGVPADASLSAGELLDDGRWLLNPENLDGLQLTPGEHNGDDFTLTVRALSREGENDSVAETVAELPVTINAVADAPELEVTAAVGTEDSAIALDIAASLVDIDGSETLQIYLEGVPADASLSAGELLEDDRWLLSREDLAGLQLIPSEHNSDDFTLTVRALSREGENDSVSETVAELPVTINAVADAPELEVTAAVGTEDSAIALDIAASLVDIDGSETLQIYLEGAPADAHLSAGELLDDGRWLLSADELAGLQLLPGVNNSDDFVLMVRVLASEGENGSSSETVLELPVTVNAVADAPDLAVSAAVGSEDNAIALDIASSLADTDGSEILQVYLEGVPADASLSAGELLDDGRWLLSSDELAGLQLLPGVDNSNDFTLTLRAVSVEGENDSSSETVLELPVTVNAVADAPELEVTAAVGTEDSAIALDIAASLVDIDGSETLQIYLEGAPADARLSAGELLDDGRWLLNTDELAGLQLLTGVNNSDDFVLMVRALASEGENGSLAETVMELPVTVNAVADAPELAVSAAVGAEDGAIALDIASSLVDFDGSEALQVYLEGVPGDASLSAGELLDDGRWLLSAEDLAGLQLSPGKHNGDDFTLTVRALSREGENDSVAEMVAELPVTINAVADAPELEVAAATGNEDSTIALDIAASLIDFDGSETLQIYLEGVPADASLSASVLLEDGRWLLNPDELAGLQLVPGVNNGDDFTLTVRAVSGEGENSSSSETVLELPVTVNAIADAPDLAVSAAVGGEDSAIALDIASNLVDRDGSEQLHIYIDNVPEGAELSAGVDQGDGSWLLREDELVNLTITPPANSDENFELTIRSRSIESGNGDYTEVVASLPVSVSAVADKPHLSFDAPASGDEDTEIALKINSYLEDNDGSESLTAIYVENVPSGASLNKGELYSGSTWRLSLDDLDDLSILPPADSGDDFTLKITAVSVDNNDSSASHTEYLDVHVNPIADEPVFTQLEIGSSYYSDKAMGTAPIDAVIYVDGDEDQLVSDVYKYKYYNYYDSDLFYGEEGDYWIFGEQGDDILYGADGNDTIFGGSGDDIIRANYSYIHNDTQGFDDDNWLHGNDGDDHMRGSRGSDHLFGGSGDDALVGGAGNDTLYGDTGHSSIRWTRLKIDAELSDSDGSEAIDRFLISGVPADSALSVGALSEINGSSIWEVPADQIHAVELMTPAYDTDISIDLEISAMVLDSGVSVAIGVDKLSVNIIADIEHGNDALYGEDGDDILYGGGGDDILGGGADDDVLYGEGGDDELSGASGNDKLYGGDGNDILRGDSDTNPMRYPYAVITGNNELYGGAGNDDLISSWGDDKLYGGSGDDSLMGSSGDNLLDGGDGNDYLQAYRGDNKLYGGDGDDQLYAIGGGYNKLYGGDGNDHVEVSSDPDNSAATGTNYLHGGYGDDKLVARIGDSVLYGGDGDDVLWAFGEENVLYGDDGDDYLWVYSGDDVLYGGDDNDILIAYGGDNLLYGGEGEDRLVAYGGNDELYGGDGADELDGGDGVDLFFGGDGDDTLYLGTGDILSLSDALDLGIGVYELADFGGGAGLDTAILSDGGLSVNMADLQIEIVEGGKGSDFVSGLGLKTDLQLSGYYGNDELLGGDGNDIISGGEGADILIGGAGDDVIYADGKDTYISGEGGYDKVIFSSSRHSVNFDMSDSAIEEVIGSNYNDYFLADASSGISMVINSGEGNDYIEVGSGNDALDGGSGRDTLRLHGSIDDFYALNSTNSEFWQIVNYGGSYEWLSIVAPNGSSKTIAGFERIQFDDYTLAMDGSDDWYQANNAAPVTLDLNGDGMVSYIDLVNSSAAYDFSGDGIRDLSAWVTAEDGFLAVDVDGDGVIGRREELVLAAWGELAIAEQDLRMDFNGDGVVDLIDFDADGNGMLSDLEGLRYFDSNQDGIINGDDEAWEQFGVWQDADSDGICDAGEFRDLDSEGITSVGLSSDGEERSEAGGDAIIYGEGSYTRSYGSTGITHDAALRFSAAEPDAEQSQSAKAGYFNAVEVYADGALDYSDAQIAADLALLRSGVEAETGAGFEHSAEAMAQMAEQARAIVAAGKVEVLEDAAADLSTRPAVEPELAKACVIAAGYLAAASVNAEGADNLPANSDDASVNLDLSEPENLFGF